LDDLAAVLSGQKEQKENTRADEGQPQACPLTGSTAPSVEWIRAFNQKFIPKRACEGATAIHRGGDEYRCPHDQCRVVVEMDGWMTQEERQQSFRLSCGLAAKLDAVDPVGGAPAAATVHARIGSDSPAGSDPQTEEPPR
jgi:hypothetical protein